MNQTQKTDWALLLMRLVFGLSMVFGHGLRKIDRLFGSEEIKFADPFGIGPVPSLALVVFAEVVCAVLLAIGLFTRLSLIPLIITMLVAAFYAHWADPFSDKEMSILYLTAYTALLLTGPGWFSVDAQWQARK
jgi:putative oxidoreductase